MFKKSVRYPLLSKCYQRFLLEEDSARFIKDVSEQYLIGTLQRLYFAGDKMTRRAAILAIGFLGDYSTNETVGAALSDPDRAVRLLAEHNIRQVWQRQGTSMEQSLLLKLESLNSGNQSDDAVELATQVLAANASLAEAWNQRAIAYSAIGQYESSIHDSRETLNCNRFHFPAAVTMGQCYLQLNDAFTALDCFRLALSINPDLEYLRGQVRRLEQMLEGK